MNEWMDGWKEVRAICNSRQSAPETRVQYELTLKQKTSAATAPPLLVLGPHVSLMASPDSLPSSGMGVGMEMGRGREGLSPPRPTLPAPTLQFEYHFLECPQVLERKLITCDVPIKTSVAACRPGSQLPSTLPGSGVGR